MAALLSSCEDLSHATPEKSPHLRRNSNTQREIVRKLLASSLKGCNESESDDDDEEEEEEEDTGSNLSICFLNEALCEEEEEDNNGDDNALSGRVLHGQEPIERDSRRVVLGRITSDYIAQNNISRKKNHVIIPLSKTPSTDIHQCHGFKADELLESSSSQVLQRSGLDVELGTPSPLPGVEENAFALYLYKIRVDTKHKLDLARDNAQEELGWDGRERQLLDENVSQLCGIQNRRRLDRQTLTSMSTGHLQVILNYFLSRVEELNEKLVQYLIVRDELIMEQDSILTDIEDITKGISI
ncbi:hypothetical protein TCAL_16859 [Tigriopus californicus]|uniref:Schwannomin interacting protein 1 C-terminal domain-containing protein n=1 Tax=Tigriopus californicus TaxID=6832 RepID=A0A553PBS0_TIGCA|nr:hypothetical protein TCAL_16859 [Tigriopus californicus]